MISCQWTPDGITVQLRNDANQVRASSVYATIDQAIDGIRILLQFEEEQYLFPPSKYPTVAHRDAEILARGIEDRLARIGQPGADE